MKSQGKFFNSVVSIFICGIEPFSQPEKTILLQMVILPLMCLKEF